MAKASLMPILELWLPGISDRFLNQQVDPKCGRIPQNDEIWG